MNPTTSQATAATIEAHRAALAALPHEDGADEADARKGFVATIPNAEIRDANGRIVWSLADYGFLDDATAPFTAHPSLWRLARLNMIHGLFKVTDCIYQVRGFDLANMTIIEGDTGLILIDPLTCTETAAAGLKLYLEHRPAKPVIAVIYSHSHTDHFGGVKGVIDERDVFAGKVQVIAPQGFMEEVVSETILAGTAMRRRSQFQFGQTLARHACCQIDSGLGKNGPHGTVTLVPPTWLISAETETHTIDGIEIVFQLTPNSEAPAEMHFYFPQQRALNLAENGTRTLHNLCPLRGAKVRDSKLWSRYLGVSLDRYGHDADVVFAQHHWPTWGTERIVSYLEQQRDLYKYLHDQTLRLANHGFTAPEIAEMVRLPESLAAEWHARGYYGTVSHDVKAIYQQYLSWYDGNPSHLNALPPEMSGPRYVEYMGGADTMLAKARRDFERGEYRWVAQVMNHLVFAQPTLREARELGAAALEQMAFQSESATWRNAFLLGTRELREGYQKPSAKSRSQTMPGMTDELFFEYLGVRIDGLKLGRLAARINWVFTDSGRRHAVNLNNGALSLSALHRQPAHLTVSMQRKTLDAIVLGDTDFAQALERGEIELQGERQVFLTLIASLDRFDGHFNVVEP